MFENLFSTSPQVWTGLVAAAIALPILIHLINLMRHKKVEWAAMEFLLRSHRKNRSWVWLKQLLLLVSRIALLVLALFMLAQVGCQNDRITQLLGGQSTHHYILLDDSFSMGQRDTQGQAFDRAIGMISTIAARAKNRQNQLLSLYAYSGNLSPAGTAILDGLTVDTNFDQTIESTKGQLAISATASDVSQSLETVAALIAQRNDENAIVYILSDFCQKDWKQPQQINSKIQQIESSGAAVELIDCAGVKPKNLAVTRLAAIGNVRAAQTPLMMEVTIKNFSDEPASKVQVEFTSAEYPVVRRTSRPEDLSPDLKRLPTVFIDSILPGATATQAFPVYFNQPGDHVVSAQLESDSLAVDNQRYQNVVIAESSRVLLIESSDQTASQFFSIVLNPDGSTGLAIELADASYLRDTSDEELDQFDTVFVFDHGTWGQQEIQNLENYVQRGGGVIFFLGPNSNASSYTDDLYRGGQGVFPIPLQHAIDIAENNDSGVSDLSPASHPVFAPVNSVKNSLLNLVQINRAFVPPIEWTPATDPAIEILATIRGSQQQPLVAARQFGRGRSLAVTTTADARWNNWMRNATYLPIMLLMQDFVAAGRFPEYAPVVGQPIDYRLDRQNYRREATLITSDDDQRNVLPIALSSDNNSSELVSTIATPRPGVYEFWAQAFSGDVNVYRPTVNVDTSESDLLPVTHEDLSVRLGGESVNLVNWDQFNPEPKVEPASLLNRLLFCLLVVVMVVEQLLGYITNYHR